MRRRIQNLRHRLTTFLRHVPWRFAFTGFLSALLLVLSFPPWSVWWLGFVGMIPFLLGLVYARSWREVAWMGAVHSVFFIVLGFNFVAFVAVEFGGLPWIVGLLILLAYSTFGEIQFLAFALLAYGLLQAAAKLRRPLARAAFTFVVLPLVYIGVDFLYPKIFPNTLGHVLYNWLPVAQAIEYVGLHGLTLPLVIVNLAGASLIVRYARIKPRHDALAGPVASVVALAVVAVALAAVDSWGRGRMAELTALEKTWTRKLKVSVIQGNIGDVDKLASESGYEPAVKKVLDAYRDASLDSISHFHPDLVVWPETSYPFLYTHLTDAAANNSGAARDAWMKEFVAETRTPIFFGAYSSVGKRDYNTAFLLKPPFELAGSYRKSILLAFGEYVPLGPLSPLITSIVPVIADFGRGPGPITLEVKGVKLGPQICYEGIFPEHSRGAVAQGADALLNITNDSWFGRTGEPWLHLLLTVPRSIELRRPMIRSTNTGVSTIVDITGEMRYSTRLFETASIDTTLSFPGAGQKPIETFYSRHGDVFAQACSAFALLAAFFVFGPPLLGHARKRLRRR
ncbi:MAG: apolipoprotein N-acyltransferase [Deltaproteobacteria bacterium]|nr:apolipoprotein N-acyltransferase [Deltaproteobacteria bacterium]